MKKSTRNVLLLFFFAKHQVILAQWVYQEEISTEQALLDINEILVTNIHNKLTTLGIFLDLRKTFDSVLHNILFKK